MEASADTDFALFPTRPIQCWIPLRQDPSGLADFFGSGEFFGKPGEGPDMFIAAANITIYSHRAGESS
jgi:hypothetical protein